MPRSASDRKFGFKSKGLIRILTAADIKEVQLALDAIGFEPRSPGLLGTVQKLLELPFRFLDEVFDIFGDQVIPFTEDLQRTIFALSAVLVDMRDLSNHGDLLPHHKVIVLDIRRRVNLEFFSISRMFDRQVIIERRIKELKNESASLETEQRIAIQEILDPAQVA